MPYRYILSNNKPVPVELPKSFYMCEACHPTYGVRTMRVRLSRKKPNAPLQPRRASSTNMEETKHLEKHAIAASDCKRLLDGAFAKGVFVCWSMTQRLKEGSAALHVQGESDKTLCGKRIGFEWDSDVHYWSSLHLCLRCKSALLKREAV